MSDVQVEIKKTVFDQIWSKVKSNFKLDISGTKTKRRFTFGYEIKAHLDGGRITFNSPTSSQPNGSLEIREVDIVWDKIALSFGVDLEQICIGGNCIAHDPFPPHDCVRRTPEICVFGDNPDISFVLNIPPFRSELSFEATAETFLDANSWKVKLVPTSIDIDPIDIADTIADAFERLFRDALDDKLPGGAAGRAIRRLLGRIIDFLRKALDIEDDIEEFLESLLNTDINLTDKLFWTPKLTEHLANNPIVVAPYRYELLPQQGDLSAVRVPIESFKFVFFANTFQVVANLGRA